MAGLLWPLDTFWIGKYRMSLNGQKCENGPNREVDILRRATRKSMIGAHHW